ncbi:tyrosine-type recombinase/integrase [Amorphus orientalis]|uniref:Integrase n=1 Tax=Amorphus orientalis TaxID=649198 RepID=A0AAE4ATD0_9HYPH|nr:tyrosine-type recombinase/integrase [Amorphus orientalis]MDQ0314879.1 integrase [Amorphus orientalis]
MGAFLGRRDGYWCYVRRVPSEITELDGRGIIKLSTRIRIADDPRAIRARKVVARLNAETETYWRDLRSAETANVSERYRAACRRARALGFDYAPAAEVAERDLDEIASRLAAAVRAGQSDGVTRPAVLGAVPKPTFRVSTLLEAFEDVMRPSLASMSEDQRRKWRNPKRRAIANLLTVIGDKDLLEITRGDALDFRAWWADRVLVEEVQIATANKDIGHLNKMLRTLDQQHRLGLDPVFAQLRMEGEEARSRSAFEPDFVAARLLAPNALDGLNDEARAIIYLMAETGLRVSEATSLTSETIKLNHEVPHVQIRGIGRKLKTPQSERDIPLVGVALSAMQRHPSGFPRYLDNAASLSALVNKALETRDLRPTKNHTLYSLRHTFEDRLGAASIPEKIVAALMGHKYYRPKYGSGPSLTMKRDALEKIAFQVELV